MPEAPYHTRRPSAMSTFGAANSLGTASASINVPTSSCPMKPRLKSRAAWRSPGAGVRKRQTSPGT
eukprot:5113489-Lingulodinium_polyedra.AAC.1